MGMGKDLWTEIETRFNNKHDLSGVASLLARDAVYTDPTGRYEGPGAIAAYWEGADEPFSDHRVETSRLIEEGDTVVAETTWWATNTGPLPMPDGSEIPATGKTVELPMVSVLAVRDGKVANWRDYYDNAVVMSQLGLTPGI
jgi:steroid delta-isomerase-like uncharacterized protein